MFTIRHRREAREPLPDGRVAALLDAAAAPTEPGPASGEPAALAAFRASHQTTGSVGSRLFSSPTPLKTAAAAAIGAGVLLTGGVAAAQTGSLPGAAQYIAQRMLDNVGVSVPGPNEHSAGHPERRGSSVAEHPSGPDSTADSTDATGGDPAAEPSTKGSDVSDLARSTDGGVEKGKAVSDLASAQGQAQRDEHASAGAPSGSAAGGGAQVTTPNTGGTSRPDQATAGGSSAAGGAAPGQAHAPGGGSATADAASGGHSSAGSGNMSAHRPASPPAHRPVSTPANRPASPPANPPGNRP